MPIGSEKFHAGEGVSLLTPDYIASLAASGKSEGLDFKSNTGARYKAARSVCAMLNQRGGTYLVWRIAEWSGCGATN